MLREGDTSPQYTIVAKRPKRTKGQALARCQSLRENARAEWKRLAPALRETARIGACATFGGRVVQFTPWNAKGRLNGARVVEGEPMAASKPKSSTITATRSWSCRPPCRGSPII